MFSKVENLLKQIGVKDEEIINFAQQDHTLATAVLLYRVIQVDGRVREAEMRKYRELLEEVLDISPDGLQLFENMVESESGRSITLSAFTEIVDKMPTETKQQVIDMMRQISISDNELHEFELNLVARTAELLKISID